MTVVFYVSGHGYGHAVRCSRVLEELHRLRPEARLLVRTEAPSHLFPYFVEVSGSRFESGMVETSDSLAVDERATVEALLRFAPECDQVVERESQFVRDSQACLLVADAPWIAGEIAVATDVPCVCIANFTWEYIYAPMLGEGSPLLDRMRAGYGAMSLALRTPLSHGMGFESFSTVVDVPFIARRAIAGSRYSPLSTVFLAGRAQMTDEVLQQAAASSDDFYFLTLGDRNRNRGNWRTLRLDERTKFVDVLASCDIVLAKLGYSLVADCISFQKRILYPPRKGFREDSVLRSEVKLHTPAMPISREDYFTGEWGRDLRALSELAPVISPAGVDGATASAEILADLLPSS